MKSKALEMQERMRIEIYGGVSSRRCPANSAHISQSRSDPSIELQTRVLNPVEGVDDWHGSGSETGNEGYQTTPRLSRPPKKWPQFRSRQKTPHAPKRSCLLWTLQLPRGFIMKDVCFQNDEIDAKYQTNVEIFIVKMISLHPMC